MKSGIQVVAILCAVVSMMASHSVFSQESIRNPEPQVSAAGVEYVSGGIGAGSQQAMNDIRKQYNLRLTFARPGSGEYLSDVHIRAEDNHGQSVLDTNSHGPFFFARLPPGTYHITAGFEGKTQDRHITISKGHPKGLNFYFAK